MNKAELVSHMSQDAGITKRQATAALESFIEAITITLKKGSKVTLVGFGTFAVIRRAARKGRNPATGEPIRIKAKKAVKFRAGYELAAKL